MKLKGIEVKTAQPRERPYKLADGGGLYLEVFPNGSKLWRLKYRRPGGRETRVSLGAYPATSLAEARTVKEVLKKQRRDGEDPALLRRLARIEAKTSASNSFETVAREWFEKRRKVVTPSYYGKLVRRFERNLFPYLGKRPIGEIEAQELLVPLQKMETKGIAETAHRARGDCGSLFRYAIATGRANYDIAAALKGALTPHRTKHFASITDPAQIAALMRAVDGYIGTPEVQAALKLAPLTFVRPVELRHAEWSEFDLDAATWCISGEKMKMGEPHLVPLSEQAVSILRELKPLTGDGRYVFPNVRTPQRAMSENTVNSALRALGYSGEQMTGHGFRAMARTVLDEVLGFRPDIIEHQLAHAVKDPNGRAYNRTSHLPERRKMMQAWADYLDSLKRDGKVVGIRSAA